MTNEPPAAGGEPIGQTQSPPTSVPGILRRIGPGLIVAGSIVGSGELIATTKTGAEAGFWLLWLILIGCVIKVFVQVEFGRYSIVNGLTTMDGLNRVPGPFLRISRDADAEARSWGGNWIVWYWFLMWLASIGQLGGIVGGVGQALAISVPLTERGRAYNEFVDNKITLEVKRAELTRLEERSGSSAERVRLSDDIDRLRAWIDRRNGPLIERFGALRLASLEREVSIDRVNDLADDALKRYLGQERFLRLSLSGQLTRDGAYDRELLRTRLGEARFAELGEKPPPPYDDRYWAALIAVVTSAMLVVGRYGMIQTFSTMMVCAFTLLTIVNLVLLQSNPSWSVTLEDIAQGMSFRLPPDSQTAVATALATFGIIGVGASELVTYPYWCLEKGYARFTGPRDKSPEWASRANGWMRVMRWDAWCSMFVYTFATMAFYLLGAAVLGRSQLNPEKSDMVRTLAVMYEPVFTEWASVLFLFGAFAVLYSTFFVANASHARVFADTLGVLGAASAAPAARRKRVVLLSGFFPLLCLVMYVLFPSPARLVLLSGLMQAIMLPMLAVAGLHFRHRCCDPRIAPGRLWDLFLWVSAGGMCVAGVWALVSQLV